MHAYTHDWTYNSFLALASVGSCVSLSLFVFAYVCISWKTDIMLFSNRKYSSDPHNTTSFQKYSSNKNGDKSDFRKKATETRKISTPSCTVIY